MHTPDSMNTHKLASMTKSARRIGYYDDDSPNTAARLAALLGIAGIGAAALHPGVRSAFVGALRSMLTTPVAGSGTASGTAYGTAPVTRADTRSSTGSRHVAKNTAKILGGAGLGTAGVLAAIPALRGSIRNPKVVKALAKVFGGKANALLRGAPLYGEAIANQARKNGIAGYAPLGKSRFNKFAPDVLKNRIGKLLGVSDTRNWTPDEIDSLLGHLGYTSNPNPEGGKVLFSGFTPKTNRMHGTVVGHTADLASTRKLDDKAVQRDILNLVGAGQYTPKSPNQKVIKKALKNLFKTVASRKGISTSDIASELQKITGRKHVVKLRANTAGFMPGESLEFIDNADDWIPSEMLDRFNSTLIAQEMAPSREFGKFRRKLYGNKHVDKFLRKTIPIYAEYGNRSLPMHDEFRVHVVNGKVIPFATSSKWDPFGHFSRFETAEKRRLEADMQRVVDKLLASKDKRVKGLRIKDQVMGFDVGIGRNGKPIIYEMNPSMPLGEHAGSGQLLHPDVNNAILAAIQGKMPLAQALQLSSGAALTGLGGIMAGSGVRGMSHRD